eukprot:g9296.t1
MTSYIKALVSSNRNRLKFDDGSVKFDLDMTYITGNLVAMGWPGRGAETIYRNDIKSVREYLDMNHKNHYMVFNLAEKSYPKSHFYNRVMHIPFPDHQPAPLNVLLFIIHSATSYLLENPKNVAVIHCKAGKGRTGMVIACLLIQLGVIKDVEKKPVNLIYKEALEYFGNARSSKGIGVQCPSQLRFVKYYCKLIKRTLNNSRNTQKMKMANAVLPYVPNIVNEDNKIFLRSIVFQGVPDYDIDGGFQPTLVIFQARGGDYKGDVLFNSAWKTYYGKDKCKKYSTVEGIKQQILIPIEIYAYGDLHIRILHKDRITIRFNINTYFLQNIDDNNLETDTDENKMKMDNGMFKLRLKKKELDKASKSDRYKENFALDLNYSLQELKIIDNDDKNNGKKQKTDDQQKNQNSNHAVIMKHYAMNSKPKYGYLFKQTGAFIKTWKARWFVLHNGILSWYDKKESVAPRHQYSLADFNGDALGTVYIKLVPIQEWEETLKPVVLKCHNEEEMMLWLNSILKHSVLAQTKTNFKEGI